MILPISCKIFIEKFRIFLKDSELSIFYLWMSLKNAILVVNKHYKGTLSIIVFDNIFYLAINPGYGSPFFV
jgi:hypothetical protein